MHYPKFLLCFIVLFLSSSAWVLPRIFHSPRPDSVNRLHHHLGDGYTEIGVLNAHEYWQKNGYRSISFLPCLNSTQQETSCLPYTHYPAGMYLFSSALLSLFREKNAALSEHAIISARICLYIVSLFFSALALALLSHNLNFSPTQTIVTSILFGISRSFFLFADNFFGHGLVLALFGILLALSLSKNIKLAKFGFFCLLSTLLSVELIPALFLFPLLLCCQDGAQREDFKKRIFPLWGVAFTAIALGMLLRLLQNAHYSGSVIAALEDWINIIRYRTSGSHAPVNYAIVPGAKVSIESNFAKTFLLTWFDHQRILITKLGIAWIWGAAVFFGIRKKFKALRLHAAIYFVSLQWTFLFVQHSMIHSFTFRYVAWPLAISAGTILPMVWQTLQQSRENFLQNYRRARDSNI